MLGPPLAEGRLEEKFDSLAGSQLLALANPDEAQHHWHGEPVSRADRTYQSRAMTSFRPRPRQVI
jgi:hypothetical protein